MDSTGPGLDLDALRGLRGRLRPSHAPLDRIAAHLDTHDGYVAFSGGKDSAVVLHLARRVDPAVPVAWFDSGLEWPETRAYIEELATAWKLNLTIIPAEPTALEILQASGAWDHHAPAARVPRLGAVLVEQPAARAHEMFGAGELWGVRAEESGGRRRGYASRLRREITHACHGCCTTDPTGRPTTEQRARHGGVIRRRDGTVAYGPIWDWSTEQVWQYLAAHGIPVNPVYRKLRQLGAPDTALRVASVLDGAHLEHGRVTWLRRGWPQLYLALEERLPRLAEFT